MGDHLGEAGRHLEQSHLEARRREHVASGERPRDKHPSAHYPCRDRALVTPRL